MADKLTFRIDPDTQAIYACIDTFEQADEETQNDLMRFVRDVPAQLRHAALVELVKVDFERRWKRGERRGVKDYLADYVDLSTSEASLHELLQVEFDFLKSLGEEPDLDEYHRICPSFMPAKDTGNVSDETEAVSDEAAAPPISAPEKIGRYIIKGKLGSGGFGVVYLAHDPQLDRDVAIKLPQGQSGESGLGIDQLHEARSVTRLDHPGIVKVYDVNELEHGGFIVYEYIQGETLESRLRGKYDVSQAAEWIAQVAEALHEAHRRGVIHRDIKPSNILIDLDDQAKVVDFGLARRDDAFYVQDAGRLLGTAPYMSPEQAEGNAHFASSLTDLYSLGIVLYEAICHRKPFQAKSIDELLELVKHCPAAPPSSIVSVDPALESVCLKAIAKNPDQRYRNGEEMAREIRKAIKRPGSPWRTWIRVAAAVVAMAAIAVLASLATQPTPPIAPPRVQKMLLAIKNKPLQLEQTPLTGGETMAAQGFIAGRAFGYLMLFEQDAAPKFLAQTAKRLGEITHEFTVENMSVSVPDTDGASYIVALGTKERLTDEQIASLQALRLRLPYAGTQIATEQVRFPSANPPMKDTRNDEEIQRGQTTENLGPLITPPEFKAELSRILEVETGAGAFGGWVISHKKAETKAIP
jgi:predicted Ser/Thr protein kinase